METRTFKKFYEIINDFMTDFDAEVSLMITESGVLGVLRYKIGTEPRLTILMQEDDGGVNSPEDVVQINMCGEEHLHRFKTAITQSYV